MTLVINLRDSVGVDTKVAVRSFYFMFADDSCRSVVWFAGFSLSWDMWWYKLVNHSDVKNKNREKSIEHLKTIRVNAETYHVLPALFNQIADWAIQSPQRFYHIIEKNLFGNVLNVWSIKHGSLAFAVASTHCRNLGLRAASTSWWEWRHTWRNMTLTMVFSQRREMFCILFSVSLFLSSLSALLWSVLGNEIALLLKIELGSFTELFSKPSAQYVFKRVSISPEL